jgi:hypothetical protein
VNALCELLGLLEVGELGLHPDGVAVGGVGDSAVDGAVAAALEAVVTLTGAGGVPVKVNINAEDATGDGARLAVGELLALDASTVLGGKTLGVGVGASVDGVDHGFVEALEVSLGHPAVLNSLELGTVLASTLSGQHQVVEGLEVGVGGAEDEGVVTGVDGGGDEGGRLSVGTGNGQKVGA